MYSIVIYPVVNILISTIYLLSKHSVYYHSKSRAENNSTFPSLLSLVFTYWVNCGDAMLSITQFPLNSESSLKAEKNGGGARSPHHKTINGECSRAKI